MELSGKKRSSEDEVVTDIKKSKIDSLLPAPDSDIQEIDSQDPVATNTSKCTEIESSKSALNECEEDSSKNNKELNQSKSLSEIVRSCKGPPNMSLSKLQFEIRKAKQSLIESVVKESGKNVNEETSIKNKTSSCESLKNVLTDETGSQKTSIDETSSQEQMSVCETSNDTLLISESSKDCLNNEDGRKKEGKKLLVKNQSEIDVGITEYVGNINGFSAVLKHRYTDFVVNEINLEGEVIHLTNFVLPAVESVDLGESDIPKIKTLLEEEQFIHLQGLNDGKRSDDLVIEAENISKEDRTFLHLSLKRQFKKVTSSTATLAERRVICIRVLSQITLDKRKSWPAGRPTYTHFVLYKENKDTMDAINSIAYELHMKSGSLTYAGTKDKRGVTSQAVSVFKVEAAKLLGINKRLRNIKVGNVSYKKYPLQLGDLQGNKFTIVLRDVTSDEELVKMNLDLLCEKGFINYYGLQRFGTTSISTQSVGRALLLGKWKEAIELILKPRVSDDDNLNACRETWWESRDPEKALKKLHWKGGIEGLLLKKMTQHGPNDYINALNGLPRNMRLMYLHSYQSYIWNLMVSKRISLLGIKPVSGDLVLPLKTLSVKKTKQIPDCLTEDNVENFSIYDVVLPLPGYDVIYPKTAVRDWFSESLAQDGLTFESFQSTISSYSLSGSYRHILVKPENVTWSLITYSDPNEDLTLTDFAIMLNKTIDEKPKEGNRRALKVEFSLPSSCYATMAIRQLTRQDTSAWAQANCS